MLARSHMYLEFHAGLEHKRVISKVEFIPDWIWFWPTFILFRLFTQDSVNSDPFVFACSHAVFIHLLCHTQSPFARYPCKNMPGSSMFTWYRTK